MCRYFHPSIALFCCLYFIPVYFVYSDDSARLFAIHKSIDLHEKKLEDQRNKRKTLLTSLQQQETAIADVLASVQKMNGKLTKINAEITQLNASITTLTETEKQQKEVLAEQLESAFKLGQTTEIDLIFNPKERERNQRILAYFGYFNRERQRQITALQETQSELRVTRQRLEVSRTTQQNEQETLRKEQHRLEQIRAERQKTLRSLELAMQQGQQKLAQLYENETALQESLAKAARQSQQIAEQEAHAAVQVQAKQKRANYHLSAEERSLMSRISGIGRPINRLNWPLLGTIRHRFGDPIQDQLYWKGIVISSPEGAQVKAIADGRVILAGWLQGYGFVVAIDHGKGDMSLYGYNQRVLVKVKDKVKQGQTIALVGNSGGQGEPGLYFEIRRDGKPFNPVAWLLR